jgi:division protein CdvB (Snf7/Vps24/ESCRT-III family)
VRDEEGGADKVIRALKHLATKHPRATSIAKELAYFRKHKKRMRYFELQSKGFMIGSGIV